MVTVSVIYLSSFLYPQPLITPGLLPLPELFLCFALTTLFTLSLILSPSPVPLLAFLFHLVPKVSFSSLPPMHVGCESARSTRVSSSPPRPAPAQSQSSLKRSWPPLLLYFYFYFFLILEHIRLFPAATKCRNLAQCCLLLLSPPNAAAVRRHCCPHQRYSQCMQELLFHFCTSSQQKRTHLGQSYSCCSLLKDQEMGSYKGTHPAGLHEVASHGVMGPGNLLSFSS